MFTAVAQDFDLGRGLGLSVKIERLGLIGGLIVAVDAVEDGVGRDMDQLGPEVEAQLGELAGDLGVQFPGALRLGEAGLDRRQRGAVDDRMREFLEDEGFEGGFGAKVEGARLFDVRDDRSAAASEGQDLMPATHGGEADFPPQESGSAGDDEFHVARLSLGGPSGKRGGWS